MAIEYLVFSAKDFQLVYYGGNEEEANNATKEYNGKVNWRIYTDNGNGLANVDEREYNQGRYKDLKRKRVTSMVDLASIVKIRNDNTNNSNTNKNWNGNKKRIIF